MVEPVPALRRGACPADELSVILRVSEHIWSGGATDVADRDTGLLLIPLSQAGNG